MAVPEKDGLPPHHGQTMQLQLPQYSAVKHLRPEKFMKLAGDSSFNLSEYAAELSRQCGESIRYEDIPQDAFSQALQDAGLPEGFAAALADAEHCAASDWLDSKDTALTQLLGRSSAPLASSIAAALNP